MAIFGKKKGGDSSEEPAQTATEQTYSANPERAARFFEHAKTVQEAGNWEYAATLWLQGMKHDPASMTGLESFYEAARRFLQDRKKPGPTKDQQKTFTGKGPVDRFLRALLEWGTHPANMGAAARAIDEANKLELSESSYWIGERALGVAMSNGKLKKDALVKLKDRLAESQAFDLAVKFGTLALQIDPGDNDLEAELRNLSAQAAMSMGGYEQGGEEGGFRKNIRDAERQRQLIDEESVVKSGDAASRVIKAAKEDYESRPTDTNAIMKYARALQESDDPDNEKVAFQILMKAYDDSKEFRFRQQAGQIKMKRGRRKLRALREKAAETGDETLKQKYEESLRKLLETEIEEYRLCAEAYPTELAYQYEVGRRFFQLGDDEQAIGYLQEAQKDAKHRVPAMTQLGQAFLRLGWHTEAINSLRAALQEHRTETDETGMEIRYALMTALRDKGEADKDLAAAEEALSIASGLAMQQIGYKDIRQQRERMQQLVQSLRG